MDVIIHPCPNIPTSLRREAVGVIGSFPSDMYTYTARCHYSDVIMGPMTSQITSLTIVYSAVYSGEDQRKHQSSASLAFVRGIHRWPVNSPRKWPVTENVSIWWRHHDPLTQLFPYHNGDDIAFDNFRELFTAWKHLNGIPYLMSGMRDNPTRYLGIMPN